MSITNYSELQSQIASYLARDDLTSQIPTFIQLSEAKLQRKFVGVTSLSNINTTNWMLTNNPDVYLYGSLLEAQPYLMDDARITTWANIYTTVLAQVRYPSTSANFTNYNGLKAAIEDWINRSDLTDAIPNFIRLAEVKFSIKFKNFTPLSVGNPTNSILTNYPDIYLYGALVEYASYVNDTANLPVWEQELANRLAIIRVADTTSSFDNYTGFKSMVADWLNRPDLANAIPTFINLAEQRLRKDLRIRQMLKVATTNTVANDATVQIPSDFLQMRDLHINNNPITVLKYESPSNFYRNTFSLISGVPKQYTLLSDQFQLAPIPDSIMELQMLYYAAPPFLSNSNSSNVFLTSCPDLLLTATLCAAAPYLMNEQLLSTWNNMYESGLQSLNVSDDQGEYAGSPLAITLATR